MSLFAPFPWFGGKRTVAAQIWDRLGDVINYVEPFFGSGAVLLSRTEPGKIETINDKDRYVANFWRAVKHDPEAVAHYLDWPVNEVDLSARHTWLLTDGAARIARCEGEPDFFDAQAAGYWCWGACIWIGSGWCSGEGPWIWDSQTVTWAKSGSTGGEGINKQLPRLGGAGRGINRKRPHLGGRSSGVGVHSQAAALEGSLLQWILDLANRFRYVRVCCGNWDRVCGASVTFHHGLTGVFLDPPYADTAGRTANLYAVDSLSVAHEAREWAIREGRNSLMRIVFAGYEGEHQFPPGWDCVAWKANGGYGSQGEGPGRDNSLRERLWFSPACLPPRQVDLFSTIAGASCHIS